MHIYLDESGNTASLTRPSATRHFALVAIVVADRDSVEHAIRALRHQIRFQKEFKSHSTPLDFRIELLRSAVSMGLVLDVMVVDKESLTAEWQQRCGLELYKAIAGELLADVATSLVNSILVIDEVDRHQTAVLQEYVRAVVNPSQPTKDNPRRIKKIVGHNSRQDDLLQLADVVAGAVFRAEERGDSRCLDIIRCRVRWHKFSGEIRQGS
jgi:hypothetical protein